MFLTERKQVAREQSRQWRAQGHTIALVPTMGSLHAGHLALVKMAVEQADRVMVSVFVNPAQFGPEEDFAGYPRNLEQDCEQLANAGCHAVFAPDTKEMYGASANHVRPTLRVVVGQVGEMLEGASRPGHFDGVATVVTKLFNICQPDLAVFGDKDYQQLLVIRRLVTDLDFPIDIIGHPIVRADDGLALSSRNHYLNADERNQAPALHASLQDIAEALRSGSTSFDAMAGNAMKRLGRAGFEPDYVAIRSAQTLANATPGDSAWVILAAAQLGKARLIDNVVVENVRDRGGLEI